MQHIECFIVSAISPAYEKSNIALGTCFLLSANELLEDLILLNVMKALPLAWRDSKNVLFSK